MAEYSLEIGEYVYHLTCDCCGKPKNRIWGFVSSNGDAHAIYYALLNLGEVPPRVGLTLSVGPWWDGTQPSQRSWVHVDVWPKEDGIHMSVRDPKESNFYPWDKGGAPLNREQLKASSTAEEIWRVADFIVESDPAICSYLNGGAVNTKGREMREGDNPLSSC